MTSRNQVLTLARSQVGYTEKGNNRTKYWAELQPSFSGSPWCAAFVVWVLKHCGSTLLLNGPSAPYYTPSMEAWAKKTGRWKASKDCKPGDVLIFGSGHATHTGFLRAQDGPNHVLTIEGNTSSGSGGSQTNGGGVYLRRRPRSWVRGCIDLSSEFGGKPSRPTAARPVAVPKTVKVDGELGPQTVAKLQAFLNAKDAGRYKDIGVDGDIGPATIAKLQWMVGVKDRDGEFGPVSARAAEKWLGLKAEKVPGWYPGLVRALQETLNKETA